MTPRTSTPAPLTAPPRPANRYDRMEWAGAFGDLGTLIPFVVAYLGVLGMDPTGVLLAFGASMVACGLHYRTPIPVQPMKAIGAVAALQAAQTATITPETVHAAALVTGLVWLALGSSGAVTRLARLVPPPVVGGIVLGLGLGFMAEGVRLMHTGWWIAAIGAAGTLALLRSRTVPAMFVLLAFGVLVGAWQRPELLTTLSGTTVELRLPGFALAQLQWDHVLAGAVLLALPQVPLTLGNAVIAISDENNRRFPHAPVTERRIALSTGLMNLFSAAVGGVPQCHGAGGMAGHVAFGARTGGALVILGGLLLVLAIGFGGSVQHLLQLLPPAVLGVFLLFAGVQLARGTLRARPRGQALLVVLVTAAAALWNVALAFVAGWVLWRITRRPEAPDLP